MSRKEEIIREYKQKDFIKNEFDRTRSEHIFRKRKHAFETKIILNAVNSIKKDKVRILDVACGTGRLLEEIAGSKKNISYVGLDTSREMLGELRGKNIRLKKGDEIRLVLSDAEKIPFRDNTFDVVFSYHLLWHIPFENQKKIIREMMRVANPDGLVIFDTINKNFLWKKIKPALGMKNDPEMYCLSISDIKKIMARGKIARIHKQFDIPIKNRQIYEIFNITNRMQKILPESFFHLIYYGLKK